MADRDGAIRDQLDRQIAHWSSAVKRLDDWRSWASEEAWRGLESYLGVTLNQCFNQALERLQKRVEHLEVQLRQAQTEDHFVAVRLRLLSLRSEFIRVETMLDFFGDAINTRTSPYMAALLRACDILAETSIRQMLDQFGKRAPRVLTYLDKGMGASILKAGLRLWDGSTINPVSTIKIVRHNLLRPTSLIHEAGHQVAHQLDWNPQLAAALSDSLRDASSAVATSWSDWASEVCADIFAFLHTGYASIAALHDVVAGEPELVFAMRFGDPHPISFLRVLWGVEMCRKCYGNGPWDSLASAWTAAHPIEKAHGDVRELLRQSVELLPKIADICLNTPLRALGGKGAIQCLDPQRVSPRSLDLLEKQGGQALFTSSQWTKTECIRITALTGFRSAVNPGSSAKHWKNQENMMLMLGGAATKTVASPVH